MMRVQTRQRIVADRAQGNDLFARFEREGIIDFHGGDLRVERQIARAPIVNIRQSVRLAFGAWRVNSFCEVTRKATQSGQVPPSQAASTRRSMTGPGARSDDTRSPRVR